MSVRPETTASGDQDLLSRTLPGAVGTQKPEDLTLAYFECETLKNIGPLLRVTESKILNVNDSSRRRERGHERSDSWIAVITACIAPRYERSARRPIGVIRYVVFGRLPMNDLDAVM